MNIYTDWFLRQGYKHHICQDYVLTGPNYIIVADGCSTAHYFQNGKKVMAQTDVGARILCHATKWIIEEFDIHEFLYDKLGKFILSRSRMSCDVIGVNYESLKATLMFAYYKDGLIRVLRYGDGYQLIEDTDYKGVSKYEYSNNAPDYLSYQIRESDREKYIEEYGGISTTQIGISSDLDYFNWDEWDQLGSINDFSRIFDIKKETFVITLMTDGISSFTQKDNNVTPISDLTILNKLCKINPGKGEFLKRRCNSMFRDLNKNNIDHYDDLGIASMYIKMEE